MATFSLEAHLPPCEVTRQILEATEVFVNVEVPAILGIDRSLLSKKYGVSIETGEGREALHSVTSLDGRFLPNDVKRISLGFSMYSPQHAAVNITFKKSDISIGAGLEITASGDNAKEKALQVRNRIFKLLNEEGAPNRLLHPHPLVGFVRLILLATLIGPVIAALASPLEPFSAAIIAGSTSLLAFSVASFVRPYHVFETRQGQKKRRLAKAIGAILGTIILGLIGSALYDWLKVQ